MLLDSRAGLDAKLVKSIVTGIHIPSPSQRQRLGALEPRLSEYVFEVYDVAVHPALALNPRDAFTRGIESSGLRIQRTIPYDEAFLITTLPTTPREPPR